MKIIRQDKIGNIEIKSFCPEYEYCGETLFIYFEGQIIYSTESNEKNDILGLHMQMLNLISMLGKNKLEILRKEE